MILKALMRIVTTAVLCVACYSLGRLPGAPSVGQLYDKARAAVSNFSGSQASDMASNLVSAGREKMSTVFSSADQLEGEELQAAVEQPVFAAQPQQPQLAQPVNTAEQANSMPMCW